MIFPYREIELLQYLHNMIPLKAVNWPEMVFWLKIFEIKFIFEIMQTCFHITWNFHPFLLPFILFLFFKFTPFFPFFSYSSFPFVIITLFVNHWENGYFRTTTDVFLIKRKFIKLYKKLYYVTYGYCKRKLSYWYCDKLICRYGLYTRLGVL